MSKLPLLKFQQGANKGQHHGGVGVVAVYQDEDLDAVCEQFKGVKIISAQLGVTQLIHVVESGKIRSFLIIGLGLAKDLTSERLRLAGGWVWQKLAVEKQRDVWIHVDSFLTSEEWMGSFAEGLCLGNYRFRKYKTGEKGKAQSESPLQITFYTADRSQRASFEAVLQRVSAILAAIQVTRDWSNEPSNHGTPTFYAQEAKKLAVTYGLKCRVMSEAELRKEKMGLILGVGQGSSRESRFVIVEYQPKSQKKGKTQGKGKQKATKTIVLVGKGVTFDSGGISIKPALRMENMKHDMTGAATVMGSLVLAAQLGVRNRVVGVMPFVENMPDGHAIQPGNILSSRSGKTVEIINTDAEGRLILGDALDFAQDLQPDVVIDVATLTGAVSIALGKICCAILGNDQQLIEAVQVASEVSGERLWQLPLYDEYFEDLKSEVADMKNSANDANGGTIRGAIFLKQFIRTKTKWAHLDIAGTAYDVTHLPYFPKKGANGAFVRTLAQFIENY